MDGWMGDSWMHGYMNRWLMGWTDGWSFAVAQHSLLKQLSCLLLVNK